MNEYSIAQSDKFVCAQCFEDYAIKDYIAANAVNTSCDYCKRSSQFLIAAPLHEVGDLIFRSILFEWNPDPRDEGISWDYEDEEWTGMVINDTYDLLTNGYISELDIIDEKLLLDILSIVPDEAWIKRGEGFFPKLAGHDEVLLASWRNFSEHVKHHTRYLFLGIKENFGVSTEQPDEFEDELTLETIPIALVLEEISKVLVLCPVCQFDKNSFFYRVRIHEENTVFKTGKELGTPPLGNSVTANRMNPAGIPMFYGAFDKETALKETYSDVELSSKIATLAKFEIIKPLKVLDLTVIPKRPSLFDDKMRSLRWGVDFLEHFIIDIQKPVTKDGKEHIDYVPTQVFTEYIRHIFRLKNNERLDGIKYPSAQNQGKASCVLFVTNEECCDENDLNPDSSKNILFLRGTERFKP